MNRGQLKGQKSFALGHYYTRGKGDLTPADPRPLGKWLRVHTDLDGADLDVDVRARAGKKIEAETEPKRRAVDFHTGLRPRELPHDARAPAVAAA